MPAEALIICPDCECEVAIPTLQPGQQASCPQCQCKLTTKVRSPVARIVAYGVSSQIMLILSLPFSFLAFSMLGIYKEIILLDAAQAMFSNEWPVLAVLIILTTLLFPSVFIGLVLYAMHCIHHHKVSARNLWVGRLIFRLKPWLMTDVFMVASLVSLGKLADLTQAFLGWSFFAFILSVFALLKLLSSLDREWFWREFSIRSVSQQTQEQSTQDKYQLDTRDVSQKVLCQVCCNYSPPGIYCSRCQASLRPRSRFRLQATLALLIAATVLYIPANLYPMMTTVTINGANDATIIGGVRQLIQADSYIIATIIFTASFIVPIFKIIGLGYLCYRVRRPIQSQHLQLIRLYRVTDVIGRWSMIDVFVVAISVALMQNGMLLSIYPGPAALAFTAVVLLTMFAAMVFDPRYIWNGHAIPNIKSAKTQRKDVGKVYARQRHNT